MKIMKDFTSDNTKKQTATAMKLCLLAAILFLWFTATAANQVVTSNANSGPGTLRQAIAAVGSGETISFNLPAESGIITISAELLTNKFLTIEGTGQSGKGFVTQHSDYSKGENPTISKEEI